MPFLMAHDVTIFPHLVTLILVAAGGTWVVGVKFHHRLIVPPENVMAYVRIRPRHFCNAILDTGAIHTQDS